MDIKELEEKREEAIEIIREVGKSYEVIKFLRACAVNLAVQSITEEYEDDCMSFIIDGLELVLEIGEADGMIELLSHTSTI